MSISDMYKEMIEQMYELSLYNIQENDITNYDDCSVDSDIGVTILHELVFLHGEMLSSGDDRS